MGPSSDGREGAVTGPVPQPPAVPGAGAATGLGTAMTLVRNLLRPRAPGTGAPGELPRGVPFAVRGEGGATIWGRVMGAGGPLVVLAHGWTNDARVWSRVAHLLVAGGHRVVAYDQRGHGSSSAGVAGLTLPALAGDLAAVLAHVDACDAVVAGHSMGGMAVQALAAEAPDVLRARVRSVALVSTACDGLARFGTPADALVARAMCRAAGSPWTTRALASAVAGPWLVRSAVGDDPDRDDLRAVAAMFAATPAPVRRHLLAAMHAMDLSAALGSLELPVLVVSGSRDALTPPARSRRVAGLLPCSHLVTLDGRGHMLPLEAPGMLAGLLAGLARGLAPQAAAAAARRGDAAGVRSRRDGRGTARSDGPPVGVA